MKITSQLLTGIGFILLPLSCGEEPEVTSNDPDHSPGNSPETEGNPSQTEVAVSTEVSDRTIFLEGWKSATYSVVHSRRTIAKSGMDSLIFPDRADQVRESPDQKMIVSYGPPQGWQIHRIAESGFVKVEDQLPKNEDLQLYWISNQTLVGVSVIYEKEMRPGREEGFAKDTRLFVYDVEASESRDLDLAGIDRDPGTFFRLDSFSKEGFIKLSLVNSDQYFSSERIRDLGTFRVSTK